MFDLLANTTFWVALSFLLFIAMAYRFGRMTVLRQLDSRIDEVRKKIATAESLRVEAQEMLAQYQRKQRDAIRDAEKIIDAAKVNAARIRKQAEADLDESLARREQMMVARIERMQQDALREIQERAADLAIAAAEELVAGKLDKNANAALVEESIRDISSRLSH
ncbi:MAG: hypothetical protein EOM26_07845 [Alphaproteobacteria bacterium]|nr:hypothetical protein [Alphaproteobacteria bacterium]